MVVEAFERWNKCKLGEYPHPSDFGIHEALGLGVVCKPRAIEAVLNKLKAVVNNPKIRRK